jgi:hypothetical protein
MNNTQNTQAFYVLTWMAFLLALIGMMVGLARLEADIQTKAFFLMTYLFSTYAAFTLAKVIRDKEDNKKTVSSNVR